MKKILLTLSLITFSLYLTNAQNKIKGSKIISIIETEIDDFHTLELGEDFEVQLTEAAIPSVEIETDDNLHDVIEFEVRNGILSFRKNAKIRSKKKLNIIISYNTILNSIKASDNAEIITLGTIKADSLFNLDIRDKARINLDIDAKNTSIIMTGKSGLKLNARSKLNITSDLINIKMSNSSKLEAIISCDSLDLNMDDKSYFIAEGKTEKTEAKITGSGNFDAKNFNSGACSAILNEDSDFAIQIRDNFTLNASGNSETYLYGNPKISIDRFTDKVKLYKKEL